MSKASRDQNIDDAFNCLSVVCTLSPNDRLWGNMRPDKLLLFFAKFDESHCYLLIK